MDGLRKSIKSIRIAIPGRDLNLIPPKYKSRMLPIHRPTRTPWGRKWIRSCDCCHLPWSGDLRHLRAEHGVRVLACRERVHRRPCETCKQTKQHSAHRYSIFRPQKQNGFPNFFCNEGRKNKKTDEERNIKERNNTEERKEKGRNWKKMSEKKKKWMNEEGKATNRYEQKERKNNWKTARRKNSSVFKLCISQTIQCIYFIFGIYKRLHHTQMTCE